MAPTVPIDFTGQKESRKFSFLQTMGKSKKYSKGHSAHFVPDHQHAMVDTMGDSEGFGSSCRLDTEITASQDSYNLNRKSISLNVDGYGHFDVPMQVLSLSKILPSEKKDLESRLKLELEQVRVLQKKIASLTTCVVLSPSSDIKSCSDGHRRPAQENNHRYSELSAPPGKKRAPPGRNGVRMKRSTTGRFEPQKQSAPVTTSNVVVMKQCETLLRSLMSHQFGWVFNTPVDVVKLNISDYFTVIKHPMDLGTVKSNLTSGQYSCPLEFAADVRLTFSNAMTYNPPGNDVHFMGETLSKSFESRWKSIEKKVPGVNDTNHVPSRSGGHLATETATFATEVASRIPPLKKKKMTPGNNGVKPEPPKQIMTEKEKINLSTELEALQGEFPERIVDFLKEQSSIAGQPCDDEIEIDIDALSDETLFKLRKLLDDFLLEKQKKQEKAEPCELELLNEPGLSTSSLQPCKVDEDIDIVGGNDAPSYPPVEIEKDAVVISSKCSSSSSSSSDSGSSSSDSGSSSGSESVGGKSTVPKENLDAGAKLDQKQGQNDEPNIVDEFANGLGQIERNPEAKSVSAEVDDHQEEGESTPLERQVSPQKLYRAALLRNRFADTILKAHEKALEKGEKRDPEKLRMEREELERRQREDKARLQAEAKAAEAAAEARRKREQEREAARQKLQEMEKTVEINESSQFLQDLEMLSAASNCEDLPNITEEASPVHSQNLLGSFKLQGSSNPLEQLGLYMKDDGDDEEEEVEGDDEQPRSIQEQPLNNNVEDGEID